MRNGEQTDFVGVSAPSGFAALIPTYLSLRTSAHRPSYSAGTVMDRGLAPCAAASHIRSNARSRLRA